MSDAAYNAESRIIEVKFDIHLGPGVPLQVTRDNYLVEATLLEEAQSDSRAVFDEVSSNELTLDLYNTDNIFTPTNALSPYYGYMKKDVVIEAYGRATTLDAEAAWLPLGTFYVKQWTSSSGNLIASITANDRMYSTFDAPTPVFPVKKGMTIKDFYTSIFGKLNVPCVIDDKLTTVLPYAYVSDTNKALLTDLTHGALALCYCGRTNSVQVESRLASKQLRATITDADQIISVESTQSIDTGYDGASVVCNTPQESAISDLVSLKEQTLKEGSNVLVGLVPSRSPIIRLSYSRVTCDGSARVQSATATPNDVSITVDSTSDIDASDIAVCGTYVEVASATIADTGNNLLALNSKYIQTPEQAASAKAYLQRVVACQVPLLTVNTRGNFLLKLGDKVRVSSSRFSTEYTGIIIRSKYTYTGGLSCVLTLMDASLFGEVT